MTISAKITVVSEKKGPTDSNKKILTGLDKVKNELGGLTFLLRKGAALAGTVGLGLGVSAFLSEVTGRDASTVAKSNALRQAEKERNLAMKMGLPVSTYREAITPEGEQAILEIDEATGNIRDILTMEEARAQKLVDNTGELNDMLENVPSQFDDVLDQMDKIGDDVILSEENMENIVADSKEDKNLIRNIKELAKDTVDTMEKASEDGTLIVENGEMILQKQKELQEALSAARRAIQQGRAIDPDSLEGATAAETLDLINVAGGQYMTSLIDEPALGVPAVPDPDFKPTTKLPVFGRVASAGADIAQRIFKR